MLLTVLLIAVAAVGTTATMRRLIPSESAIVLPVVLVTLLGLFVAGRLD